MPLPRSARPAALLALTLALGACAQQEGTAAPDRLGTNRAPASLRFAGAVYAMTNAPDGNAVVHYGRRADGTLVRLNTYPTGGNGVGSRAVPALTQDSVNPLNSSDSLKLSPDKRLLFAANAGSHSVTEFRVNPDFTLTRVDTVPSGGRFPTSVAVHGRTVYVGHAGHPAGGVPATLNGLRVRGRAGLSPIPGARFTLSDPARSTPTEVLLSPDGSRLVVSDFSASVLSVFEVDRGGGLGRVTHTPSAGANPFGAKFLGRDRLIVTEAAGGARGASSVSSYRLTEGGGLRAISAAVPNGRTAACWLTLTPDGRYAYASNTGDGTVSLYAVGENGALTLLSGAEVSRPAREGLPTSGPTDTAISADGQFFYQQFGGLGVVGAYRVGPGGHLTPIPGGDGEGLPALGAQGLAGF